MAVKNHALDDKIVAAARAEFMEKGFRDASLHKIAQRAGTTTGAVYNRYKGKDDLFRSLVSGLLERVAKEAAPMAQSYIRAQQTRDPKEILSAIRQEEKIYQTLLFDHSEDCFLLMCRSSGSSLENLLNERMEQKAQQTVDYLREISRSDLDLDGVGMLITEQFHFFRKILEKGYDREKALSCIRTVEVYMEAGWNALFEAIL